MAKIIENNIDITKYEKVRDRTRVYYKTTIDDLIEDLTENEIGMIKFWWSKRESILKFKNSDLETDMDVLIYEARKLSYFIDVDERILNHFDIDWLYWLVNRYNLNEIDCQSFITKFDSQSYVGYNFNIKLTKDFVSLQMRFNKLNSIFN